MAVHRRSAARRSDAPAHDSRCGPVRRGPAESGRRTDPACRPLAVRLQEHQVDRTDPAPGATARRVLAARGSTRVRVLRERQSHRRSSALEPGKGSPAARVLPKPSDGNVQWLWRSGRRPLCRHGSEAEFLEESSDPTMPSNQFLRRVLKPFVFVSALTPAGYLAWAALTGNLSANPLADITNGTG